MFEGLLMLLSLSTVMAIASFLAGMLPLSLTLSQSQLRLLTTLGMGVLVGTSLIVIIPEGIDTLYSASNAASKYHKRAAIPLPDVRIATTTTPRIWTRDPHDELDTFNMPGPVIPSIPIGSESGARDPPKTPTKEGEIGIMSKTESTDHDEHDHEDSSPHAWVGIALISGFILMYLIDALPQLAPAPTATRSNIFTLSDLSSNGGSTPSEQAGRGGSFSTTLGLLIHAFADGIALGASSTMPGLSFIVFFAIMIHKAPAAFGLTTVLLRQGLTRRQARVHLAAFSLAAPAGAIATWLVVALLGGIGGGAEGGMKWWTGLILLFSGGTFLFVAMHTMQEVDSLAEDEDEGSNMNGYLGVDDRGGHRHKSQKSFRLIGAAVVGMIIPAITQIGHAH